MPILSQQSGHMYPFVQGFRLEKMEVLIRKRMMRCAQSVKLFELSQNRVSSVIVKMQVYEQLSKLLHASWPCPARLEPRLQQLHNTQSIASVASDGFHLGNPCPTHTKHSFESSSYEENFLHKSQKHNKKKKAISRSNAQTHIARLISNSPP